MIVIIRHAALHYMIQLIVSRGQINEAASHDLAFDERRGLRRTFLTWKIRCCIFGTKLVLVGLQEVLIVEWRGGARIERYV